MIYQAKTEAEVAQLTVPRQIAEVIALNVAVFTLLRELGLISAEQVELAISSAKTALLGLSDIKTTPILDYVSITLKTGSAPSITVH
jgi:hypothetical protein